MHTPRSLLPFLLALASSCANQVAPPAHKVVVVSPIEPMKLSGSAYEAAAHIDLPDIHPGEGPGLHHVFKLSDNIISGAEPSGFEALEQIYSWGVRTILSVDGKVPDAGTAAGFGMRYVHVPIEYSGMDEEELLKIAKTFRELEGPFYVHCFHGKHRGPAVAAIGRIVLDEIPRERAIAEMRQWCATASKYEGLYATVATAAIPTAEASAAFEFDFDAAHSFQGLRGAMIEMTRKWDLVKAASKRSWGPDPQHPDVDPLQEALQLSQLFEATSQLEEIRTWPDDFRAWLEDGRSGSEQLVQALEQRGQGIGASAAEGQAPLLEALARADVAYTRVAQSCAACHASYRD